MSNLPVVSGREAVAASRKVPALRWKSSASFTIPKMLRKRDKARGPPPPEKSAASRARAQTIDPIIEDELYVVEPPDDASA